MFGCLVAGRLPQTNLQQIDETHCMFELSNASSINHLCVFMTGVQQFPEGTGASVHFHWPGKGFQLLGMLSNDKPSAIFRLRGTYTSSASNESMSAFMTSAGQGGSLDVQAQLGLSLEPLHNLLSQFPPNSGPSTTQSSVNPADAKILAERIGKHLFNYLSSFFSDPRSITPDSTVPMGAIKRWYDVFLGKINTAGVGFLERRATNVDDIKSTPEADFVATWH